MNGEWQQKAPTDRRAGDAVGLGLSKQPPHFLILHCYVQIRRRNRDIRVANSIAYLSERVTFVGRT
jgi:hypothetical protein